MLAAMEHMAALHIHSELAVHNMDFKAIVEWKQLHLEG